MKTTTSDIEITELRQMLRPRSPLAHKGTMGHALLISGSRGMAGATVLSAEACLRSGIGKLSIHTPACNLNILQVCIPEAIVAIDRNLDFIGDTKDTLPYNAIGIGPGMGTREETGLALKTYLANATRPMVIDADAINMLGINSGWISLVPKYSILTPHAKEAKRLLGIYMTLDDIPTFAQEHQVYFVLKGHDTAIYSPTGEVRICKAGNAGMATAGSGDVLTGIITGLLAQGYTPGEASQLGVWLHATAGDCAAEEMGEECMLARDIIRFLPKAFRILKNEN